MHDLLPGLAAAALAGCGGHYAVHGATPGAGRVVSPVANGVTVVADGGLFVSATVAISAASANALAAAGIVGYLIAANDAYRPSPPRMRADRTVNEQDCAKPIANATANLNCR